MEEIQAPKKERKFLKVLGEIALTLFRELLLNMGKKVINKVGNKRQNLVIAFVMVAGISYASIDSIPYPITTNKQKLGWQTTGNGLVYRGRASDTITKPSNYTNKDIKAYLLVDTVNNVMYSYIASKGGWQFNNSDTVIIQGATMPFDSITFNTAKDGTVGVGEVEYNDTQGSLIQGLKGGNVTNVIGQQLHQRVNNRTGATLNKGDVVYLSGSQGNRITVAKALATSDPTSANTFGIVAESIADNQSGYIITEGLITGLNTSSLTQDSAVYLSGTTAGALTSTKPQAPIHGVYIGVCVESSNGNGKIFCKIRNGLELDELHDVQISSPINNASLYFKSNEGLWRDTTAALLVSDTALMLTPYLRKLDTVSLSNRINLKLNISDTASMLIPYFKDSDTTSLNLTSRFATKLNISDTASMLIPYFKDSDTTSLNLTSRFATKLNISDTASMLSNYLRSGVAASTYQAKLNGTGFVKASGTTITYDNSTYLTTATASSTYLPLIGGTLTGALSGTTGTFNTRLGVGSFAASPTLFTSGSGDQEIHFTHSDNIPGRKVSLRLTNNNSSLYTFGGLIYALQEEGLNQYNRMTLGINTIEIMHLTRFSRVGIMNNSPSYTLDVNGTFNATGNSLIGGTLGVTGAATFSNTSRFIGNVAINTTTAYKPVEAWSNENDFISLGVRNLGTGKYSGIHFGYVEPNTDYRKSAIVFQRRDYTGAGDASGSIHLLNVTQGQGDRSADLRDAKITISNNGNVGVNDTTPSFNLDIGGTLGVTGATTLSAPLTVNSSAVFNEGSTDSDFRIESDGNANMLFVDASTDRVGIGTSTPSKTLEVNGEVKINTTSVTPTVLLGKDANNVVGQLYIDGGLSIVGNNLFGINPSFTSTTSTSVIYASGYMNTVSSLYIKITQNSTVTITLPSATGNNGRLISIKNLGTGAVISNSSNVEPFNSSSLGPNILPSGGGKWANLVSDGTNWVIMSAN